MELSAILKEITAQNEVVAEAAQRVKFASGTGNQGELQQAMQDFNAENDRLNSLIAKYNHALATQETGDTYQTPPRQVFPGTHSQNPSEEKCPN